MTGNHRRWLEEIYRGHRTINHQRALHLRKQGWVRVLGETWRIHDTVPMVEVELTPAGRDAARGALDWLQNDSLHLAVSRAGWVCPHGLEDVGAVARWLGMSVKAYHDAIAAAVSGNPDTLRARLSRKGFELVSHTGGHGTTYTVRKRCT